MTVMKPLLRVDARKTRSGLRKSTLVLALLASGAASFAKPIVYNDSFTLSTSNQSVWGSGANSGFDYSLFAGAQWGKYANNSGIPEQTTVGNVSGFAPVTIVPSLCAWTPWGDICTPDLKTPDTRVGATLSVESSGRVGLDVKLSGQGGGVSVVMPVATNLQIGDAINGNFRVSGGAVINTAAGGAKISATGASFRASIDAVMASNSGIGANVCVLLAGCFGQSISLNQDIKVNLVTLDTTGKKPINAFGLIDLPFPGVNKYYEIRSDGAQSKDLPKEGTGDTKEVFKLGGPLLGKIKINQTDDFSGDTITNNTLSANNSTGVAHILANSVGIAEKSAGLPKSIANPEIKLNIPGVGPAFSLSGTLFDYTSGVVFGLEQTYAVTPKLKATLTFDKPISEYVQTFVENREIARRPTYSSKTIISSNLRGDLMGEEPYLTVQFVSDISQANQFDERGPCVPLTTPWGQQTGYFDCYSWESTGEKIDTVPVYRTDLVKRGNTVTVDLDKGANLKFTDGDGSLVNRTFTMGDEDNFRSKAVINLQREDYIKAACFNITVLTLGINECAYEKVIESNFGSGMFGLVDVVDVPTDIYTAFDDSFALRGFNNISFSGGSTFNPMPPNDGEVPEPSSLWLVVLALLGLRAAARRTSVRV